MLVVGREGDALRGLVARMREDALEVVWVHDTDSAVGALARTRVDALVTSLRSPRIDGFALLAAIRDRRPDACAVVLSDAPELALAVEAMRRGAWDVQAPPWHAGRLLAALRRGLEHLALAEHAHALEEALDRRQRDTALAGRSRAIVLAREQVARVAPTRATVLIEGEEGTGKALVARALHAGSPRRDGPFVALDAAGLPGELIEAELFGIEGDDGAPARRGRIERADGGTLLLDGVELLPQRAQVRLLRLLQDRTYERVGGARDRRADVRVLAASAADLADAARDGRFRDDLYRMLAVVRIALPPLRARLEDLPLLVDALLAELGREHGRRPRRVTRGVLERLASYAWPGNVAELKRVLEALLVDARGRGPLDVGALPPHLRESPEGAPATAIEVGMTLAEAERALVEATLRHAGGDKPRAAAMLGIGLRTLYRKLDAWRGRRSR